MYKNEFTRTAEDSYNSSHNVPAVPKNYVNDDGYWWYDGPPPEWAEFWRAVLPRQYQNASDKAVEQWANQTDCIQFFDGTYNPSTTNSYDYGVKIDDVNVFSNGLASLGGCPWKNSILANDQEAVKSSWYSEVKDYDDAYSLTDMMIDCMLTFCCPLSSSSELLANKSYLFPGTNWTAQAACSFNVCTLDNRGNADLGGIGVSLNLCTISQSLI